MSIFNSIRLPKVGTSTFNLSHDKKFSMSMGDLVPMLVQECVPGDKFNINTSQMLRMMPMIAPVMHEVNVYTHFFFVPTRLLWKNWEKFITGGESGLDQTLPPTVSMRETGYDYGTTTAEPFDYRLADYLGLPVKPYSPVQDVPLNDVSLLPFLAYQKIYNDYYRDQNLIENLEPLLDQVVDGNNNAALGQTEIFKLQKRAWQHDYFTSALPFAQKGNPVRLPLGTTAPITFNRDGAATVAVGIDTQEPLEGNGNLGYDDAYVVDQNNRPVLLDNSANLEADLSEATSATINDLRRAVKLQEWLEKNARAGSRYVESILAHFGVRSSDARLQRPEYIGGGMSPVMISEVLQTSETATTALGEMAGHGLNLGKNGHVSKYCEEHGFIIGICSVMPRTAYQQGIPRLFSRFDKFDYFWPDFQHIGEQEVKNKELIVTGTSRDEETFGYNPRYSEYKYNPSTVHGYFKTSLDFWHMGRIFDKENPPNLNKEFIEANPTRRIFAVEDPDEDVLLVHMYHSIHAKRKMSYYGEPSFR